MACLDVHYKDQTACAAAIVFDDWSVHTPIAGYSTAVIINSNYEPGQFYRRELKPLLAVIELIAEPIRLFIIDAYCYLFADRDPGLGTYLHDALNKEATIIGVAKNRYKESDHAEELFRGGSKRALFITSIGMPKKVAASRIASMPGGFRIPTIIKAADQLARNSHNETDTRQKKGSALCLTASSRLIILKNWTPFWIFINLIFCFSLYTIPL